MFLDTVISVRRITKMVTVRITAELELVSTQTMTCHWHMCLKRTLFHNVLDGQKESINARSTGIQLEESDLNCVLWLSTNARRRYGKMAGTYYVQLVYVLSLTQVPRDAVILCVRDFLWCLN